MADKGDLTEWVYQALAQNNGRASLIEVAKWIWENHERDLRESGNLFYTWQYDIRWSAMELRKAGKLRPIEECARGIWELKR